jgi:hypothetical protein
LDPFLQVRIAAIHQLAAYEAVNSIIGGYEPYLQRIAAPKGASPVILRLLAAGYCDSGR